MRQLFKTGLLTAIFMVLVSQAHAGSISFGFSSGHHYDRHGYKHHSKQRHWPHHYNYSYYTSPRPVIWSHGFTTHTYYPQYIYVPVVVNSNAEYEDGYCREYQAGAIIGGRKQSSYGTACLQPDGSWKIVN